MLSSVAYGLKQQGQKSFTYLYRYRQSPQTSISMSGASLSTRRMFQASSDLSHELAPHPKHTADQSTTGTLR
jgi:hypothetical protein